MIQSETNIYAYTYKLNQRIITGSKLNTKTERLSLHYNAAKMVSVFRNQSTILGFSSLSVKRRLHQPTARRRVFTALLQISWNLCCCSVVLGKQRLLTWAHLGSSLKSKELFPKDSQNKIHCYLTLLTSYRPVKTPLRQCAHLCTLTPAAGSCLGQLYLGKW